jgi:hypothetical protein
MIPYDSMTIGESSLRGSIGEDLLFRPQEVIVLQLLSSKFVPSVFSHDYNPLCHGSPYVPGPGWRRPWLPTPMKLEG